MNILLIEDQAGFAEPIKEFLQACGHIVTWIIGAHRLEPSRVIGIIPSANPDPREDSWNGDYSRLVTVDLAGFKLAFVDGGLVGTIKSGWDIVPTLTAHGIICIAISGGGASSPTFLKAGASIALPKELVVLALRSGNLNPKEAVENPELIASRLPTYIAGLRSAQGRHEPLDYGFPKLAWMF